MHFSLEVIIFLFVSGLGAGCIDAIAGGGGIITLPVLLSVGMSPAQALATNKLQGCAGTLSATSYYLKRGWLNLKEMRLAIIGTFVGASCGTLLVQTTNTDALARIIPLLLIGVSAYFLLSPSLSNEDRTQKFSVKKFSLIAATSIGFYDGFFGPGTGSFFTIALVTLLGMGLPKATAHAKLLNLISNLSALIFFIIGGKVLYLVGLIMGAGQFLGAKIGSRLVILKGRHLIKPLTISVAIVMAIKLLLDQYLPNWQQLTHFL